AGAIGLVLEVGGGSGVSGPSKSQVRPQGEADVTCSLDVWPSGGCPPNAACAAVPGRSAALVRRETDTTVYRQLIVVRPPHDRLAVGSGPGYVATHTGRSLNATLLSSPWNT
ncbi:unnamed protein product, partial [Gadus morhua 'NCC']